MPEGIGAQECGLCQEHMPFDEWSLTYVEPAAEIVWLATNEVLIVHQSCLEQYTNGEWEIA